MKGNILISQVLGISDDREQEITKYVMETITKETLMDTGIQNLVARYDPESILAGMRLQALVMVNNEASKEHKATIQRQKADQN